MPAAPPSVPGSRQERRKAETRSRIVAAADALFQERGYADTSIDDIARSADVAVRTIYLHFESKAAIMLDYFDGWVDAFVAAVLARPIEEPIQDTLAAAMAAMAEEGWIDRVETDEQRLHPLVEHIGSGPLDIAGHVLQRWTHTLTQLIDDAYARGEGPVDPVAAQARAISVFAFWFGAMTVARERQRGTAVPPEANGAAILDRIVSGQV